MDIASFYKRLRIKREYVVLFIVLAIAFFLRLYHLGFRDFWYDEVCSFYYAQHPLRNWNPPLYWILLHFWIKVFGASEFSLRFPSLLFSLISVFLVYLLGKRLFSPRVGIYAAVFMAFSPFHIQYAQEARPYSLSLCLSILSVYSLHMALINIKFRFWLNFIIISIIGFYNNNNYYHIFLYIAQWLCVFLYIKKDYLSKMFYLFVPLLAFSLWIPRFILKLGWIKDGGWWWMLRPDLETIQKTIENFSFGNEVSLSLSLCFLAVLFLFFAVTMGRKDWIGNLILCFLLFIVPIAFIFVISQFMLPVYRDRGLIIFSPYYYLILAVGLSQVNRKLAGGIITVFILLYLRSGVSYYTHADVKKHFKLAVRFVEDNIAAGDIIAHAGPASSAPFIFYSRDKENVLQCQLLPSQLDNKASPLFAAMRIWFIFCPWGADVNLSLADDRDLVKVKNYLNENYKQDFVRKFDDGLCIFRYIK